MKVQVKKTISIAKEVEIDQGQIIQLRLGDKQLWNLGYILSLVEINGFTYVIVSVYGHADHAYRLDDLQIDEDEVTLYFYCGS